MAKDADKILQEIRLRMEQIRPSIEEYHQLETLVATMETIPKGGTLPMASTRQRKRKTARRQHHNTAIFSGARLLTEEQVKEIKSAARKQHIGYRVLMAQHGYVQNKDTKRWGLPAREEA